MGMACLLARILALRYPTDACPLRFVAQSHAYREVLNWCEQRCKVDQKSEWNDPLSEGPAVTIFIDQ